MCQTPPRKKRIKYYIFGEYNKHPALYVLHVQTKRCLFASYLCRSTPNSSGVLHSHWGKRWTYVKQASVEINHTEKKKINSTGLPAYKKSYGNYKSECSWLQGQNIVLPNYLWTCSNTALLCVSAKNLKFQYLKHLTCLWKSQTAVHLHRH